MQSQEEGGKEERRFTSYPLPSSLLIPFPKDKWKKGIIRGPEKIRGPDPDQKLQLIGFRLMNHAVGPGNSGPSFTFVISMFYKRSSAFNLFGKVCSLFFLIEFQPLVKHPMLDFPPRDYGEIRCSLRLFYLYPVCFANLNYN